MSAITLNDKRQIVIELSWLLSALDADQKRELADSLACEESIIEDVAAQLLDGWTERASHGAKSCSGEDNPTTALDKARRELSLRAGEVAAKEIESLKRALIWAKQIEKHYCDAYFRAYHAWGKSSVCPSSGDLPSGFNSEYEVVKRPTHPETNP